MTPRQQKDIFHDSLQVLLALLFFKRVGKMQLSLSSRYEYIEAFWEFTICMWFYGKRKRILAWQSLVLIEPATLSHLLPKSSLLSVTTGYSSQKGLPLSFAAFAFAGSEKTIVETGCSNRDFINQEPEQLK